MRLYLTQSVCNNFIMKFSNLRSFISFQDPGAFTPSGSATERPGAPSSSSLPPWSCSSATASPRRSSTRRGRSRRTRMRRLARLKCSASQLKEKSSYKVNGGLIENFNLYCFGKGEEKKLPNTCGNNYFINCLD